MPYDYDLVVLGGGPAGERGAALAASFGKRVALIEAHSEPGGAAVHTGTLPSKTLRETAIFLSGYRQSELYGMTTEVDPAFAVRQLLARKNAVRKLEVARIRWNLDRNGVRCFEGSASLVDGHTVALATPAGAHAITAQILLIATGSEPYRPADIPFDDEDIDDSDTILLIDRLPKKMVVIGGGVIGCEYASMFAAMHVKITLIEGRDRLLPFLDREMGDRLQSSLAALGIDVRLDTQTRSVKRDGEEIVCELSSGDAIRCGKLLVASGRSGRSATLNLAATGVVSDKRGYIKVNDFYATDAQSVYAAGDVIGFPQLASASMEQARVAVSHAFGLDPKKQVSEVIPYGVYTIPEVSSVGLSEEKAREEGLDFVVGRAFYRDNARGKIVGDHDGVLKLIFERSTRKLLGCHCIGDRASELVHLGQLAILLGGTADTFSEMVFNYPTLSELFKYAAYEALRALA